MFVYFFESSSPDAKVRLETLQREWGDLPYIRGMRLLENTQQAGLFLLVVETTQEPPKPVSETLRVWAFREADN
ncbi:MAG: hypothetical protein ACRCYY_12015 [Trueperaceae bacterium]